MNRLMAKTFILLISLLIIQGCGKEELPQDKLIGDWTVFSTTDEEKKTIIWEELKDLMVSLISEYECFEFTATATKQIISTKYTFIDVNGRGCLSPIILVYTWSVDPETGEYNFIQGTNKITYEITFTNDDNRMTWKDKTSGAITVWERVGSTNETTE
ncbi:MAG: hypothetical protein EB076_07920 [Flavobacteriia bacterium]|nr:hypothetical protein [Flavobacteriia bacterium]